MPRRPPVYTRRITGRSTPPAAAKVASAALATHQEWCDCANDAECIHDFAVVTATLGDGWIVDVDRERENRHPGPRREDDRGRLVLEMFALLWQTQHRRERVHAETRLRVWQWHTGGASPSPVTPW